jgi:hypothetical protein
MKLCMIGNSHISKTYVLWNNKYEEENPNVKMNFFIERAVGTQPFRIKKTTNQRSLPLRIFYHLD